MGMYDGHGGSPAGLLGLGGLGNAYAQGRAERAFYDRYVAAQMTEHEDGILWGAATRGVAPVADTPKNIREELQQKVTKWLEPVRLT